MYRVETKFPSLIGMCVCVYIYIYVYMCVYIYIYIYMYVRTLVAQLVKNLPAMQETWV